MARTIDLGKVVGEQGPQGETGPQGPQGEQGPEPTNVVHKTGDETISGRKEFSEKLVASAGAEVSGSAFAAAAMPVSGIDYSGEDWESGHVFTAPYSGWLVLNKVATAAGQHLEAFKPGGMIQVASAVSAECYVSIVVPMLKSDTTNVRFSADGNWNVIRFLKAKAE